MRKFRCIILVCMLVFLFPVMTKADGNIVIELDPGHGGMDGGASTEWFGEPVVEKDMNLKIGKYLKEELEQYEGVTVYMTRSDDRFLELEERTKKAMKDQADVLISLHNNASGEISDYDNGSTVLTATGYYRKELAEEEMKLGSQILAELSSIGLEDQGFLLRTSENNSRYPNGKLADYYYIINQGITNNFMSIIIEHGFLDHGVDYKAYLHGDDALKRLAQADAKGIARYYGLKKEGKPIEKILTNRKEKLVLVGKAGGENKETYETFYPEAIKEEESQPEEPKKTGFWQKLQAYLKKLF